MNYTVGISDLLTNMHNAKNTKELEDNYNEVRIYISSLDLMDNVKETLIGTANRIHTFKQKKMNA